MERVTDADDLHERIVHGDESALGEVHDRYAGIVHGVALRVTGSRGAAEEITQEVVVYLWQRPYAYRPERGSLRTWLCLLAHRRAVDWVRAEQARRRRHEQVHRSSPAEDVPSAEEQVIAADEADRVRAAVVALPAAQREAIELAYFAGITHRQVAAQLGVPEGTVKSRMRSGLRQLARVLGTSEPGAEEREGERR